MSTAARRFAVVTSSTSSLETVQRYLPANYDARSLSGTVYIFGHDNAGWTLDGYVIPRLQSGLHGAREISEEEYRAQVDAVFARIADKVEDGMA
jgi:hypothetical protein